MFTGSPSQPPFYGSWNMQQCYGVRFLFNVGTGSRILSLQTSLQINSHLSVNTVSENLQQTRTNNDVLTHKNNFFFHELYFWSINTSHTQMKQFIKQKQHFPLVLTLYNFDVLECYVKTHEQCLHLILPFSSKKVGAIKRIKDLNIRQNDRANNYKA